MPELPDITIYIERLDALIRDQKLERLNILNPFVLRTVTPTTQSLSEKRVLDFHRIGKRIALGFEDNHYLVIHLMIAGRIRWRPPGKRIGGKLALAALRFPNGTLYLTEAGSARRASLHIIEGQTALSQLDRGGLELFHAGLDEFTERLRSENHTLKRALTDPRLFSGIGNAYSDEILHHARLSPLALSQKLSDAEVARLFDSARATLELWTNRIRADVGENFPEYVTAFREGMAVHGRYRKPCPSCGSPVQRIRYATNETNYCARCQTGGRLLADRALSRLLKQDWPRSLEELE